MVVKGIGDLVGGNQGNFFYVGGTSMATPHVASVAALMLQKNRTLTQDSVQFLLKASALALPPTGSRSVFDFDHWATSVGTRFAAAWPATQSAPV